MLEILFPIEDTCISKYNAKVNFGKSDSLLIGSSSSGNDYYKTLLKFDISSIFSKVSISRVLLRLYVYKKEKTGEQEVSAYKLIQNFNEMEVNWNNQPSHEELGSSSNISDGNLNGYFDIDVTSIVNQWLNDKNEAVHGIEVIASESASSFIWFRSREYTQDYMWPRLIVEYDDSKLVTDNKQDGDVSIESCNLYQLGNNFSAAYKVKKSGTKETLAVLEISDDGLVWFSEKAVEVVNGEYKVIATSSSRKYDRISLVIIKEPELFLSTGSSVMAQSNIINENSAALKYNSNDVNIPVDESGQITINKTGTANISINPKSVKHFPNISFNVVGQVKDDEELSNALDDASITNINIPEGNFSIYNHSVDASRNITISGMVDNHGNLLTNLILSNMHMYISSLENIKVELKNINIIGLTPNAEGINFEGQFLLNSSINLKNVHMKNFKTALNFKNLSNIDISECEFANNSEALVFNNVTNCSVSKTKFKDNSKSSVTIEDSCSNMDISAEFENSSNNDFIGISMINNNTTPSNINITGSGFTEFDWRKRVAYTNIPDLPENHVIYGVSTENDLSDVLANWTEIGAINILQDILNIAAPIEIKRPVILSGISRQVTISASQNISNLSFTPYSSVIAADSSNVTIQNLTIDGNNFAQNGIYVHGDNCSIYNNIIENIVRPEGKAACGDGIIAYSEGNTALHSPINNLNAALNIINNTARHGIFVEAFNTETEEFFKSTNINVANNAVDNVWNNPLTPIETKEPNGIFSAAVELQGLEKSTTEFKDNLISNVKNNLKESYIYFIDTDETFINGVLESHKANLISIKIGNYSVDLSQALITALNPNGTNLIVSTITTAGISIVQGEPNETVVVKVNGSVIDKNNWDSNIFNIGDVVLVESKSQDTVVTNVYKIVIYKKTFKDAKVKNEQELRAALAFNSPDSADHITLLNDITLTSELYIDKYVFLDSDGSNKFTLITPKAGKDITFVIGADESMLKNLIIDGELVIDIGPYGSMSLYSVRAASEITVLSADSNSIHLNGVNAPVLKLSGSARVVLDEDGIPIVAVRSKIENVNIDAPEKPAAMAPVLQIASADIKSVRMQSPRAVVSVEGKAAVETVTAEAASVSVKVLKDGSIKTVQFNAPKASLTLDNGASVETLNLNANDLTIDGRNIAHVNVEAGVTDINTIDVKGYESSDPSISEANNALAVVFALTQDNIKTIKLNGIFEGIPISGKSITNISGLVNNKIVTVDDSNVLKFAVMVYSIIKINLLQGIYDEALEIKTPMVLQGTSGAVLKQKTGKVGTETAIVITSSYVQINGLQIEDWNVGIETKEKLKNVNIMYCEVNNNNYGIVFNNIEDSSIDACKLKDNVEGFALIKGKCSEINISSEFTNSLSNNAVGISLIGDSNPESIPEYVNITDSSFIGFGANKRIVYDSSIPNLPFNHVIYNVSTESDLRDKLKDWPEVGIVGITAYSFYIDTPIEIKRPVILRKNPGEKQAEISVGDNIGSLSFSKYSAVIGVDSDNVTIKDLIIDGNWKAQNGIYVHGNNCCIEGNSIQNIIRPMSEAACGAGIMVYKEGTTVSHVSINTLKIASNNIGNTDRQGIFVGAYNTEAKEFFTSTGIYVVNNTVDDVWKNPLTPIETSEPNGMFSAAVEIQGVEQSTTTLENNSIFSVGNNLKQSYIYFIDTDETLINGVLASHKANLSSIVIGEEYTVDLDSALKPEGATLSISADTAVGIKIDKGEPNETLEVEVNGETLAEENWESNVFNVNDVILVKCTSQDTVLTKVYKITIMQKLLRQVDVGNDEELKTALEDSTVGHITLTNNITLSYKLDINKYIILDSNENNKWTLTTQNLGSEEITLINGSHGSQINNLIINGVLTVNIKKYERVSLHNVNVAANDGIKVLSEKINSMNLYGVTADKLSFTSAGTALLSKYTNSGTDIKTQIETVEINAPYGNLIFDEGAVIKNLKFNSNDISINGESIVHLSIENGVTDINTINVKGYKQSSTSVNEAEASNALAVVFALAQANITTINLNGIFEGIPISGKSITNIKGLVSNKIVTVNDSNVLKFVVMVYSIININLLLGVYDEALEINRPISLQGTAGVILKQKTEKALTETAILITSSGVQINGLQIEDWNVGIEVKGNLYGTTIEYCEITGNSKGVFFDNVTSCLINKCKLKYNFEAFALIKGKCFNLYISSEFTNSLGNNAVGISLIGDSNPEAIPEYIDITSSSFTDFGENKRIVYDNIPDLPENHVIYNVSTESDLRDKLKDWPEIGTIGVLKNISGIIIPIEIKRAVILKSISYIGKVIITADNNIENLSFTSYSAVIGVDSNNVSIKNFVIDGNNHAQSGIYVHGDSCFIYGNEINNIEKPIDKAVGGDGIIAYKEGTTAQPLTISNLKVDSNIIRNTVRHGIFVGAFNTETKKFFTSTNINIINNTVGSVWRNPLTPIETQEPNKMSSAAIELHGVESTSTTIANNTITNVQNNLKKTYVYYSDTNKAFIDGKLASQEANLNYIKIGDSDIDLSEALVTDGDPNGTTFYKCEAETLTGISIKRAEVNETVIVKLNGTVINEDDLETITLSIDDTILVESTSQDIILTNVYKIVIGNKSHAFVENEAGLRNALNDVCVNHITLKNDITLTRDIYVNKYIILDSDTNQKYTLRFSTCPLYLWLNDGYDGIKINNLNIENGGLFIRHLGEQESVAFNNIDVFQGTLDPDVFIQGESTNGVVYVYGMNTNKIYVWDAVKIVLDKYNLSGTDIKTKISEIYMDAMDIGIPGPILEAMNSEITTLNLDAKYSSTILKQGALVGNLIIKQPNANVKVTDNVEIKTVKISNENSVLNFEDTSSVTAFYLKSNNINITCPASWITSEKFIVDIWVDKSTVIINGKPIPDPIPDPDPEA